MYERHLKNQLVRRFKYSRSVYIFGPRQSGKTTLARETFPELPYLSLEEPDLLEYIKSDPRAFFNQIKEGAIIDEPQRYPDIFSYLQGQIDIEKKKFILTSSQNFLAMESISQSLAGRISILTLLPLTKQEIEKKDSKDIMTLMKYEPTAKDKHSDISALWPYLLRGGYPEVNHIPETYDYWYADYIKTYLERDVRRLINVNDIGLFQRFLKLCAGRTGNILNKASLASDCGISETTCTRWLSLLEQSGIIMLLKPYYKNFNKRQTKSPKLIFIDSGLCCFLLSIRTLEHLSTHPLLGSLLEAYVITEVYKTFLNQGESLGFYYWRDQHGHEVDLLIEMPDGVVLPIEIKAGQTVTSKMIDGLKKWLTLADSSKCILAYGGKEYQIRDHVRIVPIDAIL